MYCANTHSLTSKSTQCHVMIDYWLSKQLWSSKLYSKLIQSTSPRELAWKQTLVVNDRKRVGGKRAIRKGCQSKHKDRVEGYTIISTILSSPFSCPLFLSSCFGANRFICQIGHSIQSARWLLKAVYRRWPCLTFDTIDYSVIHQRNYKPLWAFADANKVWEESSGRENENVLSW